MDWPSPRRKARPRPRIPTNPVPRLVPVDSCWTGDVPKEGNDAGHSPTVSGASPVDSPYCSTVPAKAVPLFERFTDRARRVVVLAQEEARLLNPNYIGTEHILLGLIHEGEGVAARSLGSLVI